MILEIAHELGTYLAAKGCPIPVVDGPSAGDGTFGGEKQATWGREYITVERDESGDTFEAVRGAHRNPKHVMTCKQGIKIVIRAQATAAGALSFEHFRRAEAARDMVLTALAYIAQTRKNNTHGVDFRGGRFVDPEDLAKSEDNGGAVYELRCAIDRGVYKQTWAHAIRPEATPATIHSTTGARLVGVDEDDAETACGG